MKIRIKSHSIRFRLDPDDLQQFLNDGYLTVNTHIPTPGGEPMVFSSRVTRGRDDEESRLTAEPFGFTLILSPADCDRLASTDEGIYIRREWTNEDGREVRFLAYIEKDKTRRTSRAEEQD